MNSVFMKQARQAVVDYFNGRKDATEGKQQSLTSFPVSPPFQ